MYDFVYFTLALSPYYFTIFLFLNSNSMILTIFCVCPDNSTFFISLILSFILFRRHIHEQGEATFRIRFLKGDKNPEDAYEFPDDRFVA